MEESLGKVVHELLDESKVTFDKCSTKAIGYKARKEILVNNRVN